MCQEQIQNNLYKKIEAIIDTLKSFGFKIAKLALFAILLYTILSLKRTHARSIFNKCDYSFHEKNKA